MTWKHIFRSLLVSSLLAGFCVSTWAASLELGQIRANRRGWADIGESKEKDVTREVESFSNGDSVVTEERDSDEPAEAAPSEEQLEETDAKPEGKVRIKRVRSSSKRRSGLILIGSHEKKKPTLKDGYLAVDVPPSLRFSDADPVNARPPSPALPEFNFVSGEYVPYLIETELSEDELAKSALLSEIVIEMPPHEVVSGKIETRRDVQEELVEHFDLEEQHSTVLRPEEVLIYFETDTNAGKTGAMVPFSPATPTTTTIKSSATLTKE